MKQEIAEQNITNDSETPRNMEIAQEYYIPEYLKDPQRVQSIISSNQELIHQQAMTIKSLQITNLQQEEIIHNLQQKYEAIAQLATNPASPATLNIKNQTSGMDLQSFSRLTVEDMVDKIVELQQALCKTKVQLALKEDELLSYELKRNNRQSYIFAKESSNTTINRQRIEQLFEAQPIEPRSLREKKDEVDNKELIEQWNKIIEVYRDAKLDKFKEKIHPLIKRFIPKEVRPKVWSLLLENRLGVNNSLYIHLLDRRAKNWVCPKVRQQIDRDIKRSFYGKTQYQTKTGLILEICEFLEIFHIFRPDVSYIQGMTYPAIILIPILGKIKAFTVFCNLILANNFFRKVFSLQDDFVSTVCRVFQALLAEYNPNVSQQLQKHSIQSEIFLIEWVFTLFSRGLSYQTILKFWDHLLYYEQLALFRISLSVFDQLGQDMLNRNYEQTIDLIRNAGSNLDEQKLLDSFCNSKLTKERLNRVMQKTVSRKK